LPGPASRSSVIIPGRRTSSGALQKTWAAAAGRSSLGCRGGFVVFSLRHAGPARTEILGSFAIPDLALDAVIVFRLLASRSNSTMTPGLGFRLDRDSCEAGTTTGVVHGSKRKVFRRLRQMLRACSGEGGTGFADKNMGKSHASPKAARLDVRAWRLRVEVAVRHPHRDRIHSWSIGWAKHVSARRSRGSSLPCGAYADQ